MSGATLPEGWSLKRLDELARVTSGKRLPKGRRLSTAQTDHPYIRVTDMFMGGVDSSGIQYVPDDVFPEIAQFTVASGDIFISCAGTLGLVGIVPESLNGANLTENANRIWSIQCDRRFLLSVLMSDRIQSVIQSIQTVGAQPKLALGRIRSFEIPCPDNLPEQQAIAVALSDADGVVAGLERVIAKKRLIKQGAMQDLLTARRRLPGFSGEWEVVRLSDVGTFKSGSGFPLNAQGKTTGSYPFFKVSDFSNQGNERTLNRANHYIDESDRQRIGARVFQPGTIAFAKIGAAIFLERKRLIEQESCLDNNMAGYTLQNENVSRDLILANLQQFSLGSLVASTALPAIGSGELNSIAFPMPSSPKEQQAIAAVLSDMDAEIQTLESRLAKARAVKEGMMQNLLTGRVRLV